jgi:hypothetical protein
MHESCELGMAYSFHVKAGIFSVLVEHLNDFSNSVPHII